MERILAEGTGDVGLAGGGDVASGTTDERALQGAGSGASARRRRLGWFAQASRDELEAAWADLDARPDFARLRGPEVGLVMLRGRIGGTGASFNLGEVSAVRATVRLDGGEIGHAVLLGGDRRRAELAAVFDALAFRDDTGAAVARLCAAVESRLAAEDARRVAETAATRVDFFTLVRGEDE